MNDYVKYFELAAFVTSLIAWPELRKSSYLKIFPFLLGMIVAGEFYGYYLVVIKGRDSLWFYNIFNPCQFFLYLLILYLAVRSKMFKKVLLTGGFLIIVFVLIWLESFYVKFNIYMYFLGTLLVIIGVSRVIYETMEAQEEVFLKLPVFYMFFSILVFYSGTLPMMIMNNWLGEFDFSESVRQIIVLIFTILNLILYGTYTFCFLWIRRKPFMH